MKVDVHNHAFPEAVIGVLERNDTFGIQVKNGVISYRRWPVGHELSKSLIDPAAKVRELELAGLEGAVICVEPSLFAYDVDLEAAEALSVAANQGMAEFCRAYPDRLWWMAQVPLQSPERAAKVLDDAARSGAVGVEIGTAVAERRPDAAEFQPFWSAVERLNIPVFAHPAYNRSHDGLNGYHLQNVIGNLLETTIFIERLICSRTLDRHPGVRIVLAHAGGYYPFQAGRLRHAQTVRSELREAPTDPFGYSGRVFVDTITHDRQALQFLVSKMGPESVVMGTDLPYDMATPSPMRALAEAVDEKTQRLIAEDNHARLFRIA